MTKKPQGFACLSPEAHKQIASNGGRSVPPAARSFSQSRDLAAKAGSLGGKASAAARKAKSAETAVVS